MILHRFTPGDEIPNFIEDESSWWTSVQQYGATIALAAALMAAGSTAALAQQTATLHQDDPAGNLTATVDEYFWQDPVQHVLSYSPPQFITDDVLIVPQPAAAFQPDEDFWPPLVAPIPYYIPPQILILDFGDDPAGNLSATVDEYLWQDPVQHFASYVPPQLIADDILIVPQPAVTFQPDEDFWQNQVASYVAPTQVLPPWADDILPNFQGDEDFWQVVVFPAFTYYASIVVADDGNHAFTARRQIILLN